MVQIIKRVQPQTVPHEKILVVERNKLFNEQWTGCKQVDNEFYLNIINTHKQFLPRPAMEQDPRYKQIIPYLIFTHNDRYFLMQRSSAASEQRLKNRYSLGIGGHIRQEDLEADKHENLLFSWALREFHEEVSYQGNLEIEPLCLINDDSNEVGLVHVGFALLLKGDTDQIAVNSELKSGYLATLDECKAQQGALESWSSLVLKELISRKNEQE